MGVALGFERVDQAVEPGLQNVERGLRLEHLRRVHDVLAGRSPVEPGPGFISGYLAQFGDERGHGHACSRGSLAQGGQIGGGIPKPIEDRLCCLRRNDAEPALNHGQCLLETDHVRNVAVITEQVRKSLVGKEPGMDLAGKQGNGHGSQLVGYALN